MKLIHLVLTLNLFLFLCFSPVSADTDLKSKYPQDYFRSPLGIPLVLAGTFGELRNNHFHGGIDCKTNKQENLSIYSIADGYVSRVKIQTGGYGYALYIDHPNGYTSVYAHLNGFTGNIGRFVKERQYEQQSFTVDITVPPGMLQVEKGQIVAKSGNTGSSTAPHLHFEIRESASETPINPLAFGYKVPDTRHPFFSGAAIYPFDEGNRYGTPKTYKVVKKQNGVYSLEVSTIKVNTPRVGLGAKAYDKQNGANNMNGIYSMEAWKDGQKIFYFDVERISFDETRYINCHLDYEGKKSGRGNMQKLFLDPGNYLTAYEDVVNRGVLDLSDGQPHQIAITVKDLSGNTSTLSYKLQWNSAKPIAAIPYDQKAITTFNYVTDNSYENDLIKLYFPTNSFYKDVAFNYEIIEPTGSGVYSQYHQIHTGKTPVHKKFDVAIKPKNLPTNLYDQAYIAYYTVSGRKRSVDAIWEGNFLKGRSKEFGKYFIAVDETAPIIKPFNITPGKVMSKNSYIGFTISDKGTGIKSYDAYIDGMWVVMTFDAKSGRARYYFDERVGKGQHEITFIVKDWVGNTKTYTAKFSR
ncbi:MAG: M23 family metallopeptidase [Chitinophagales bacterium]